MNALDTWRRRHIVANRRPHLVSEVHISDIHDGEISNDSENEVMTHRKHYR